jgi:hypothetical protein
MCGTIHPGSCIRWVHGFGTKTGYDMEPELRSVPGARTPRIRVLISVSPNSKEKGRSGQLGPKSIHEVTSHWLLVLIKHRFHAPTCRVNAWNNHVFTLSTNLVSWFLCLFHCRNIGTKLEHFKGWQSEVDQMSKSSSPRGYIWHVDQVGQIPGRVVLGAARLGFEAV